MSIQRFGAVGRYVEVVPGDFQVKSASGTWLTHEVAATERTERLARRASAVEIFVPRGGGYWSALLGARLEPATGARFRIEVLCTPADGSAASTPSRINPNAGLHIELPAAFARAVLDAAHQTLSDMGDVGAGRLVFDVAATSDGSSEFVFDRLARALAGALLGTHNANTTWGRRLEGAFFP